LATLRTVQTIWRYERQNANAEVIARQAGNLHDQFARVLEALQDVGRHLEKSRGAYELTLDRFSRGKGNMVKRVADIAKLGAKTKRGLPPELLANSDDTLDFLPDAPDRVDDETDSNEASASTPFENGD
jgi:DNA recombination protein RmuC